MSNDNDSSSDDDSPSDDDTNMKKELKVLTWNVGIGTGNLSWWWDTADTIIKKSYDVIFLQEVPNYIPGQNKENINFKSPCGKNLFKDKYSQGYFIYATERYPRKNHGFIVTLIKADLSNSATQADFLLPGKYAPHGHVIQLGAGLSVANIHLKSGFGYDKVREHQMTPILKCINNGHFIMGGDFNGWKHQSWNSFQPTKPPHSPTLFKPQQAPAQPITSCVDYIYTSRTIKGGGVIKVGNSIQNCHYHLPVEATITIP